MIIIFVIKIVIYCLCAYAWCVCGCGYGVVCVCACMRLFTTYTQFIHSLCIHKISICTEYSKKYKILWINL